MTPAERRAVVKHDYINKMRARLDDCRVRVEHTRKDLERATRDYEEAQESVLNIQAILEVLRGAEA